MTNEKSCGTIIIEGNKVLMITSKKDIFGFPKGHIENGETEIETAIRETKEEINLDVIIDENKRFSTSYMVGENIYKEVIYFVAYIDKSKEMNLIPQKEEVNEIMWMDIDEVEEKLSFDDLKILWKEVLEVIRWLYWLKLLFC